MKLILTADVDNLGGPGDQVEVKDGYGRNYLLPRRLAIPATRGAEKQVATIRRAQEVRAIRGLEHANEVKAALEGLDSVALPVRTAGGSGRLFGSVTTGDVAGALKSAGAPTLDRRTIELPREHIKATGKHEVVVRLHPDVTAHVTIDVVAAS